MTVTFYDYYASSHPDWRKTTAAFGLRRPSFCWPSRLGDTTTTDQEGSSRFDGPAVGEITSIALS